MCSIGASQLNKMTDFILRVRGINCDVLIFLPVRRTGIQLVIMIITIMKETNDNINIIIGVK